MLISVDTATATAIADLKTALDLDPPIGLDYTVLADLIALVDAATTVDLQGKLGYAQLIQTQAAALAAQLGVGDAKTALDAANVDLTAAIAAIEALLP